MPTVRRTNPRGLKFAGHAIAFVLPVSQLPRLSDPSEFWPVYQQHGHLADSLPSGSRETVGILIDYLATEARIRVSPGWTTDLGTPIAPPEGVDVLTCMSRHDARVLRSRMLKRELLDLQDATDIFSLYDHRYVHLPELCSVTLSFFGRLADLISSDNERLIVATILESDR